MQKNRAIIESFNKGGAAVVGMTSPEEPEEVSGIAASSTRSIAKYEGKVVILNCLGCSKAKPATTSKLWCDLG